MTSRVAVHCQGGPRFPPPPQREAKFCSRRGWRQGPWPGPWLPTACHPASGSEAAYRCNPSTAAPAAGRAKVSEPTTLSISAPPAPSAGTRLARLRPGAATRGSREPSRGSADAGGEEAEGRGPGFPPTHLHTPHFQSAAEPGSRQVCQKFPSSVQRRSPLRGAQPTAAGAPGERLSSRAPRAPGRGQARPPGARKRRS